VTCPISSIIWLILLHVGKILHGARFGRRAPPRQYDTRGTSTDVTVVACNPKTPLFAAGCRDGLIVLHHIDDAKALLSWEVSCSIQLIILPHFLICFSDWTQTYCRATLECYKDRGTFCFNGVLSPHLRSSLQSPSSNYNGLIYRLASNFLFIECQIACTCTSTRAC
jgi:hypothetical protein